MRRNRLYLAVAEDDVDMVEYILHVGLTNDSDASQDGDTPLMMAITNRMDEYAKVIKQFSADLDVVNKHGQTVLHAAVIGRMDVLPQWLINETRQLEQLDCMGLTPLQQSVVADLEKVAAQLVYIGADHRSVIQSNTSVLQIDGCQLSLTTKENTASLCLKLHGRLYESVLETFDSKDADFSDYNGNSLLHLTALLANADECERLLAKGANVGSRNKKDRSPLVEFLYHVVEGHVDVNDDVISTAGCLVKYGADIENEDGTGRTALQMTISLLGPDVERLLREIVRQGGFVSKLSLDEFESCIKRKFSQFLEDLIPLMGKALYEELVTVDSVRQSMTTLDQSITRILFKYANIAVQNALLDEMLLRAAHEDDEEFFKYLLQRHDTDWTVMADGETILTALLKEANVKFCKLLLDVRSASKLVQLTSRNGDSPLMVTIMAGLDELMDELILETNAPDNENNEGLSALSLLFHKISESQRVSYLLTIDGDTALELVSKKP